MFQISDVALLAGKAQNLQSRSTLQVEIRCIITYLFSVLGINCEHSVFHGGFGRAQVSKLSQFESLA